MPHSLTKIWIHAVWSTKDVQPLIKSSFSNDLYEHFQTRAEAMKREKELKSHKGRDFIRKELLNGRVRQLPD